MPGLVGRDRGVGSAGPFSEVPQGKARVGSGPLEEAGGVHKKYGIRSDTTFGLPEMRGVSPRPPMGVHSRAQGTEQRPDVGAGLVGISGRAHGSGKLRKPRPAQGGCQLRLWRQPVETPALGANNGWSTDLRPIEQP
jgi:hypothetical protein